MRKDEPSTPTRRQFLQASLGAAALAAATQPTATAQASKPNVLMILVDDLGYGDLSSYGAKDMRTPHIDALMDAGMRMDNFYANCPVCSPTRAALLSGCYPDRVGVPGVIRTHREDNWGHLIPEPHFLGTLLKPAGYHTSIVGKWHLGLTEPNTPNDHGFDHFHGFLGDMMDDYYNHRRHGNNYMRLNREIIEPEGHATDLFSDWAGDYIESRADEDDPWFLYLAYNAPHTPVQPPEEWVDKVKKRESGIGDDRAKLVALIEHMDDGIGRVIEKLEATGQRDNTIVIFTSDNGGYLRVGANCGNLRGGKQDMYEGGIKVPMCAVWPGHIEAGSRNDRVALTMDLYATICDAAGARIDHDIDGVSILPTWKGESQPPGDRTLIWVRREGNRRYQGRDYYAARKGDFKLVQPSPFSPYELYNLKNDPLEESPLPETHKMFNELADALRDHINDTGMIPWQREPDA